MATRHQRPLRRLAREAIPLCDALLSIGEAARAGQPLLAEKRAAAALRHAPRLAETVAAMDADPYWRQAQQSWVKLVRNRLRRPRGG
jgi:hypothetical protein